MLDNYGVQIEKLTYHIKELERENTELKRIIADMILFNAAGYEKLGINFEKVLHENLWNLMESTETKDTK